MDLVLVSVLVADLVAVAHMTALPPEFPGSCRRRYVTCGETLPQSLRVCRTLPYSPILPDIYHLHGGEANYAAPEVSIDCPIN